MAHAFAHLPKFNQQIVSMFSLEVGGEEVFWKIYYIQTPRSAVAE